MTVLLEVLAGVEQLVVGAHLGRRGRLGRRVRWQLVRESARTPADDFASVVEHGHAKIVREIVAGQLGAEEKRTVGRCHGIRLEDPARVVGDDDPEGVHTMGDGKPQPDRGRVVAGFDIETDGRLTIRLMHGSDLAKGIPVLAERLRLARGDEREVGLVVGEHAGHQLDIGAVAVGQVPVPCPAEFVVSPGPLLLARGDRAVGDMDEARLAAVVIAAEEVVLGGEHHV